MVHLHTIHNQRTALKIIPHPNWQFLPEAAAWFLLWASELPLVFSFSFPSFSDLHPPCPSVNIPMPHADMIQFIWITRIILFWTWISSQCIYHSFTSNPTWLAGLGKKWHGLNYFFLSMLILCKGWNLSLQWLSVSGLHNPSPNVPESVAYSK